MRIISKLDIKGRMVVKGLRYEGLRVVGNASEIASKYSLLGVDEIFYSDIVASLYGRNSLGNILKEVSKKVFIPITAGGGVNSVDDATNLILSGADKIAINTSAVKNPILIKDIAKSLGSQCVVSSVQTKKNINDDWEIFTDSGRNRSKYLIEQWLDIIQEMGCGEIFINSVQKDGTLTGFDYELANIIKGKTSCPVVMGGGISEIKPLVKNNDLNFLSGVTIGQLLHKDSCDIKLKDNSIGKTQTLNKKYTIGLIDYGMGNQTSLFNALSRIGCDVIIDNRTEEFNKCDCIILPGVGHFSEAMNRIKRLKLFDFITKKSQENFPILGICLGMQLLYEFSEEGNEKGLGLIKGKVHKLSSPKLKTKNTNLILPHIGWNKVNFTNEYPELEAYFVHSYCPINNELNSIVGTCNYANIEFTCATRIRNTIGLQFHPERSGLSGLNLISKILNDIIS